MEALQSADPRVVQASRPWHGAGQLIAQAFGGIAERAERRAVERVAGAAGGTHVGLGAEQGRAARRESKVSS